MATYYNTLYRIKVNKLSTASSPAQRSFNCTFYFDFPETNKYLYSISDSADVTCKYKI